MDSMYEVNPQLNINCKSLKLPFINGNIIDSFVATYKNCFQSTVLQAEVDSLLCCFPEAVVVAAIYLCAVPCLASLWGSGYKSWLCPNEI